jgi:hypothetical protein
MTVIWQQNNSYLRGRHSSKTTTILQKKYNNLTAQLGIKSTS